MEKNPHPPLSAELQNNPPAPAAAPAPGGVVGCADLQSICVFCGSRAGNHPIYTQVAQEIGRTLARQGRRIVYGGGHVGLMGALADAALEAGGIVFGVIPTALQERELGHRGLTELRIVSSMHERKALMAAESDAFMALPGGLGTYEEILEAATWSLLGIHQKPLGLLNTRRFYDPLIQQLNHAEQEGFLLPEERALVIDSDNGDQLIHALATFCRTSPPKWMKPGEM